MPHALRKRLVMLPATMVVLLGVAMAWIVWGAMDGSQESTTPATPAAANESIAIDNQPAADIDAQYVGAVNCAQCHSKAMQNWQGSHHDRAMEKPSEETVEGDFSGVTFTKKGVTSRFFQKDGDYYVHTEGPNGKMRDYKVAYTFGVYPLQQYLVAFEGGRLQTLSLCWDNRPKEQGGQRWFHIHPDERIKPDDPLFWTKPLQNWNMQCAECHSTNLKKNYDPEKDQYHTTFAQIDVSCEACHGPGSNHVNWAEQYQRQTNDGNKQNDPADDLTADDMGLTVSLKPTEPGTWRIDPDTLLPKRNKPLTNRMQMQVCARCHARRSVTSEQFVPGQDWLETHQPTLLEQPLYHSDGRINEEVYVWGSFRQSKMYHQGVRCSDCHNPHSLELRMPKAQLCLKCHPAGQYATKEHHFHEPNTEGASCVSCHMPEETYMVVDPRRDHSFRVPRPDRSLRLGTPNTCTDCHSDKSAKWAATKYEQWWGDPGDDDRPYAAALDAAWEGHPAAGQKLVRAARDLDTPTIAQATALSRLNQYPSNEAVRTIHKKLNSDDPLIRLAGVRALGAYREGQRSEWRWELGASMLTDESRLVRLAAASELAGTEKSLPGPDQSEAYKAALKELRASYRLRADRAATLVNQGNLARDLNQPDKAIEAYRTAMQRNPSEVSAYANLADLYRSRDDKDETAVQQVLKQGLEQSPEAPGLHYAMAMSLVRQKKHDAAIGRLQKARRLGEHNPQYTYMLAIAYNSTGRPGKALAALAKGLDQHPQSGQLLTLMATMARDHGQYDKALQAVTTLTELAPDNARYQRLRQQIERQSRQRK